MQKDAGIISSLEQFLIENKLFYWILDQFWSSLLEMTNILEKKKVMDLITFLPCA